MSQFLSTSKVAAGHRLDYWNNVLQSAFPGMSVTADKAIDAHCKSRDIGNLRVMCLSSQRALVKRWQTTVPGPEHKRTTAHLQSRGTSLVFHDDRASLINRGDLSISQTDSPYAINISDQNVVIILDFPPEFLNVPVPAGRNLVASSESIKRLHDFALFILDDESNELLDEENPEECILGVFSTLLGKSVDNGNRAECNDLLDCNRILEFVENAIQDSALRTNAIARHLSMSPRQVQRIFAMLGMTPSQFILTRRVNLAASMLRSSFFDGTMTDVAMDCGFSDAAHFCRSFRRIFGVTPIEYANLQRHRRRSLSEVHV